MDDLKRGQNVRDFTFVKEKQMQDMLSYPRDVETKTGKHCFIRLINLAIYHHHHHHHFKDTKKSPKKSI